MNMKTTDLKAGRRYELATGQVCAIRRIDSRGRERAVLIDCPVRFVPGGPFMRWIKATRFAAKVKRELPKS